MPRVLHLIVGPDRHGVVVHAETIARACEHEVLRAPAPDDVRTLPDADVVHVSWTDRVFGPTAEEATAQWHRIAALVRSTGAALSATLHDLPHDDSDLQLRRRAAYRDVAATADGIVVNSALELRLAQSLGIDRVRSVRLIRLPIDRSPVGATAHRLSLGASTRSPGTGPSLPRCSVAVLGFVYPDRGYEHVLAALPAAATLVAIGEASAGHADLLDRFAASAGDRWQSTGYVADDELPGLLAAVQVPIAPNPRVTASASIGTWLAHGRRPLVPDSPYSSELVREYGDVVRRYDHTDRDSVVEAIHDALRDPASTWLAEDGPTLPSSREAAELYAEHFLACRPGVLEVGGGCVAVPDNEWPLIRALVPRSVAITVIIPYFEAQRQLDLVLAGLSVQTVARSHMEVIVVDDGSRVAPDVAAADGVEVRVLRQPDEGFRAARARNLGIAAAGGEVIAFLDADTVPEPDYLWQLTALPASCPDVLAVGRRRHGDFDADRQDIGTFAQHWASGRRPRELPEPAWLRTAYERSDDLLHADRRSYRYVISAVLSMSARLLREIGGFDERFVGYGGEDWELAHRAWVAGAVFAHVPGAVAWHDGPDWAARGEAEARAMQKAAETERLAQLLPDPDVRGSGPHDYPSIVVHAPAMSASDAMRTVRSAYSGGADCGFWFADVHGPGTTQVLATPGVHVGSPARDVLARGWCQIRLRGPVDLTELAVLAERAERHGLLQAPGWTLRSARSLSRGRRWAGDDAAETVALVLFGRHDIPDTRRDGPTDG